MPRDPSGQAEILLLLRKPSVRDTPPGKSAGTDRDRGHDREVDMARPVKMLTESDKQEPEWQSDEQNPKRARETKRAPPAAFRGIDDPRTRCAISGPEATPLFEHQGRP